MYARQPEAFHFPFNIRTCTGLNSYFPAKIKQLLSDRQKMSRTQGKLKDDTSQNRDTSQRQVRVLKTT